MFAAIGCDAKVGEKVPSVDLNTHRGRFLEDAAHLRVRERVVAPALAANRVGPDASRLRQPGLGAEPLGGG